MNDVVVFLGPSLDLETATAIAPFSYRPPAAQGDVMRAVSSGARAIGLIDGYFESVPAVWHKEILFALSSGVHVFGAASMGALRAAELDSYGMRGVGRVYEWYASGQIDADDEVALVHGPAEMNFLPLSEPLVNVRATLERATLSGFVSTETRGRLIDAARRLFYKQRTWPRILVEAALAQSEVGSLSDWLRDNKVDQKRLDTAAMLEAMTVLLANWPGPFRPSFSFEVTDAWDLAVQAASEAPAVSDADSLVLDEARLDPENFRKLTAAAALGLLAERKESLPPRHRLRSRRLDAFRSERGMQDRAAFTTWLRDNELTEASLDGLIAARDEGGAILDRSRDALLREIIGEIKLCGLYASLSERAAKKADAISTAGDHDSASGHLSDRLLLEWFFEQRLGKPVPQDIEVVCRSLALPSRKALQELLAREFVFATLDS